VHLLIDMNLTYRWVQCLADAGHEALHWSAVGDPTTSDRKICAYAREHGRVILTNDLDFPQILAHARQSGPSVVLLRGEPLVPEERGSALILALQECEAELKQGAIVSLD
jgi:predicted nuclease of predicted toxin-antitoxin system